MQCKLLVDFKMRMFFSWQFNCFLQYFVKNMFHDYDCCFLAFNTMTYSIPEGVYGTTRKHAFIFILT